MSETANKPWLGEKWFTSPWNFMDDVRKDMNISKNIKIHDVTLRDGEQQAGIIFNKDQKIALAEKMAEIGIHRIEAGMPAVSRQDAEAITEIAKRNLGPEIFGFARCMKEDVKRAADCGVTGIIVEIPASEHLVRNAYRWEYKRAIEQSVEATLYAKELGLYTVFFPIDCSRTELSTLIKLITGVAADGHMDALAVVDTFGGLAPNACPYLIKELKKHIDKPLEVHFHDDFGLGSANSLMALSAGADVVHTTISGLGERAGNVPYEDVVLALLTMYGVDVGIKTEKMYELSQFLQKMSGLRVRQNQGIIGEDLNKIESGLGVNWWTNVKDTDPRLLYPYLFELTGHPDPEVVIGKMSGVPSVEVYLKKIGMECDDRDQKMKMVRMIKDKAFEVGRLLTMEEFTEIAHKVLD